MIALEIFFTPGTTKNLLKLDFFDRQFLRWLMPRLAKKIRERTMALKLPSGAQSAPLDPHYAKRKTRQGQRPVRDGYKSGRMWRSLTAKVDNKQRATLFFKGNRPGSVQKTVHHKTGKKAGTTSKRYIRNQEVADLWAFIDDYGERETNYSTNKPTHNFMELSAEEWVWVMEQYKRRVLQRRLRQLPGDPELEQRTRGGRTLTIRSLDTAIKRARG